METIYDRIHEIRTRFEVLKRDAEIEYLKACLEGKEDEAELKIQRDEKLAQIDDDFEFIAKSNVGGEFMAPELVDRVEQIAGTKWTRTLDDRKGVGHEELKRMERAPKKSLPVEEDLLSNREEHIFERDQSTIMGPDNSVVSEVKNVKKHSAKIQWNKDCIGFRDTNSSMFVIVWVSGISERGNRKLGESLTLRGWGH